ncbi:MAG: hypothetical protein EBR23_14135 [Planctomycetia bacterium]|nr:hypothetical protein [Planctomycetia bacterium]
MHGVKRAEHSRQVGAECKVLGFAKSDCNQCSAGDAGKIECLARCFDNFHFRHAVSFHHEGLGEEDVVVYDHASRNDDEPAT